MQRASEAIWKNNDKLTSAILIAEVREAPDVRQINCEADDGQEEVDLLGPHLAFNVRDLGVLSACAAARTARV